MPIVNVRRDDLFAKIGETYTDDEFQDLCFRFGIENDDVVTESEIKGKDTPTPDAVWYKIDVPANRYDLLCIEGISRALRIFLEKEQNPQYKAVKAEKPLMMVQDRSTFGIRPFVCCAVLRNLNMTQQVYNSFLDLQDKLHFNIGRRRTLVAIGTHDLDNIQGPFKYTALPYDKINFVPLFEEKSFNVDELFHHYRDVKEQSHLKPYIDIAADAQQDRVAKGEALLHPVILDATGQVLSLPPVINSEYSKLTLDTKNVFIEVTATDFTKANVVLNTLIAMFSEHCSDKFSAEIVHVDCPADLPLPPNADEAITKVKETPEGFTLAFPNLQDRVFATSSKYLNGGIGLDLPASDMVSLLTRMQLRASVDADGNGITVNSPVTRSDVLHPIDIQEDVAIAYGYNNIPRSLPPVVCIGGEQPLNKLSDQLRQQVALCQYTEVMTWALIQTEENFEKLQRKDPGNKCVTIANSKTDFTACRTTMVPGLLKVVQANKSVKLPLKIFELGDVVVQSAAKPEGAANVRHLGVLYAGQTSGFEEVHGVLTRLMEQLNVPFVPHTAFKVDAKARLTYTIRAHASEDQTYLPGRVAEIVLSNGTVVGEFGIVHPVVLKNFELDQHAPCSVLEINIEPFL
jgi:phenylalanyl-tRNA synthetase beta chain